MLLLQCGRSCRTAPLLNATSGSGARMIANGPGGSARRVRGRTRTGKIIRGDKIIIGRRPGTAGLASFMTRQWGSIAETTGCIGPTMFEGSCFASNVSIGRVRFTIVYALRCKYEHIDTRTARGADRMRRIRALDLIGAFLRNLAACEKPLIPPVALQKHPNHIQLTV